MAELAIRLQPRSRREEVVGERDGVIVVRVSAPPVDGKANEALVKLLAKRLGVPRSAVNITHGHTSRDKRLTIDGLTAAQARQKLGIA
jgi:uncharacterized protein (TIGR00251 family)